MNERDSNVTHIVIVRPLADGVYNVSSARLTYTDDSHNTYVSLCVVCLWSLTHPLIIIAGRNHQFSWLHSSDSLSRILP